MIIFLEELVLMLFLWMIKMIDGIMELFSAISGVTNINYHGREVNIIEFLVGDSTVGTIFWCIFILAIGLSCIFGIGAIIKNMTSNNKPISSILGKFFLSILGTMAVLCVVFLGIMISNRVLHLIAEIFQIENTTKLSNALFNACVGEWLNGYSIAELDITSLSVGQIFGDYNTAVFGIWPTSWKCNGMVNPNSFMYLPAIISSIALVIALVVAIVNLAKRVYEIVFMYLIMPMSLSTLSLDDGARFKNWRETFVTKILLAYGTIFSVNVFVLILPLISQMSIPNISGFGNSMFLLFMIIGGAMVIPAGQTLFARLFGTADDMHAGGSFLRSAFYGTRFASLATFGIATKTLKGTYRLGKKIVHRGKKNEESDKYSDEKDKDTEDSGGEEVNEGDS